MLFIFFPDPSLWYRQIPDAVQNSPSFVGLFETIHHFTVKIVDLTCIELLFSTTNKLIQKDQSACTKYKNTLFLIYIFIYIVSQTIAYHLCNIYLSLPFKN